MDTEASPSNGNAGLSRAITSRVTQGKVTIADIARASGVSSATVSLALRNKPGIGTETRQRVLDAAQSLGYLFQPSSHASMRNGIDSIGVIVKTRPNDLAATNSFYGPVLAGIEEICRRHRIHLLYANLLVDEESIPVEAPRLLFEEQIDGLLLVGMHLNATALTLLRQQSAPLVLVDAYAEAEPHDAVVTDNFLGAYRATSYLLQQGHGHVAIIGSHPQAFPSILERRAGYAQAITDSGVAPHFWDCPLWPEKAYTAALEYLSKVSPVTAIFCANDAVALAVLQAAQTCGRQVPHELSVIGFDNIELAQHTTPALTTMRVDKMGMGRLAAQLLMNRIEYPTAAYVRTLLRPELIERQSVSSPNR